MVILSPPPYKLRDLSRPVDTSSQVSTPDDTKVVEASLEEITSPTVETPDPSGSAPSSDASYLWEEANKALGELLATKSSIDCCCWKLVWELGMSLCQNDSETKKFIKEAKAIYAFSTQEAKTLCSTTIKEAKATYAHSIQEAEILCSKTIVRWRPGEPPRLTHFIEHIPSPSNIWKNKLSKRKVRANLTSSSPVKLPYKPALWNSVVHW